MEKLVKNISKLIAQHNCVIMPGIGAFLAHRVPAYYSAKEKVFMPPHRELGFNPQVTVDDALLLSEYMGDGLLSYEEANEYLANDIDSLRSKLSDNGTVCFGDLGIFTMDIDGKISFTPNDNCIDDPYNYGFEPLAISPLKELKKKDIVIKRSSISKYVSAIAAAIILIFVLVPIGNSIYNSDIQLSVAGFTPVDVNVKQSVPSLTENLECEIAPVEETVTPHIYTLPASVQNTAVSVTEEPQQQQEVNEEIPVSSNTANLSKEASKQYSIIVASTPNPQNAQLAITELSRKMKADYQVVEGDRRFRIAIESYDNESDANAALERIQATFSDAWVYIH
ncbi:MAG: SPOR domain-containing protein [Bacteroidaceae bacterium]|nr:SPOR domain-containing protein [Bacteroidaceae bacterium]